MKCFTAVMAGLVVSALAGCTHTMTLQEARAACTRQGGFLTVIYTQKITRSGMGDEIASPGDCVSAEKFDMTARPAPITAPAPAK